MASGNKIYYLLNFHKKCNYIIVYGDKIIKKYCEYVNLLLGKYFSVEEQKQLKLYNFNYDLLYKFAFGDVEDISFDNINEDILCDFFDKISFVDIKEFY
jgi:hypothetical protein